MVAFSATGDYLADGSFINLPVVDFNKISSIYDPKDHSIFIAVAYSKLNRTRTNFLNVAKQLGYSIASYISSDAKIWQNVKIGEHCFILEQNNLQPYVEIGNNVILWSGNHIGHHSIIGDNCFVSSHVVVSGSCRVGNNCFLGVNSTLSDGVSIEKDTWIGPTSNVQSTIKGGFICREDPVKESRVTSKKFFKIPEE